MRARSRLSSWLRDHRASATGLAGAAAFLTLAGAPARAHAADDPSASEPSPPQTAPTAPAPAEEIPSATTAAPAAPARRFGGSGQVIVNDLIGFRYFATLTQGPLGIISGSHACTAYLPSGGQTGESCQSSISLAPSLDFGVGRGFTLGGSLDATLVVTSQDQLSVGVNAPVHKDTQSTLVLGLSPRIGYVLPVNDDFIVWPRVGAGFRGSLGDSRGSMWSATAEVGLVYRAGRYVFLNVAPQLRYTTSTSRSDSALLPSSASALSLGMTGSIGIVLGS